MVCGISIYEYEIRIGAIHTNTNTILIIHTIAQQQEIRQRLEVLCDGLAW